jgi:hypothetical protein
MIVFFSQWNSPDEVVEAWPDSFASDLGAHEGYTGVTKSPNDSSNSFAKVKY